MANWKKVIVSGSQASLAGLSGSLLTDGKLLFAQGAEGAITSAADVTLNADGHIEATFSGSASGSFEGDGSGLTGVVGTIENSLDNGNGIASFSYDGGTAGIEVAVQPLAALSGQIQPVSVDANGVGFDVSLIDGTGLTATAGVLNVEGLTVSEFNESVIVTQAEGLASQDDDDSIATVAAIKAYVDAQSHEDVNLGYTAAASQGTVTNDQGTDAIIPGATATEAGLLTVALSGSIAANSLKETNVTTDLSIANRTATTLDVASSDGTDATVPAASLTQAGLLTAAKLLEINNNTLKETNVTTDLSLGTATATTRVIESSDGTDVTLPAASGTEAGLLSVAKLAEIDANTLKETNVTTDLGYTAAVSSGTVTSSDGSDATIPLADATNAGLMTAAEKSAIAANSLKTVEGTLNEISVSEASGVFTVGLPDDVTIQGDLTVLGDTTTLSTTNLLVEDKFILVASGSTADSDGGIIIDGGDDNGEGFVYDATAGNSNDAGRWGFQSGMGDLDAVSAPDAFASAVVVGADNILPAPTTRYAAKGNMFIASNEDIYIWS